MRLDPAVLHALEREITEEKGKLATKKQGTGEYDQVLRIISDLENQLQRYQAQAEPQPQMAPFVPSPRP